MLEGRRACGRDVRARILLLLLLSMLGRKRKREEVGLGLGPNEGCCVVTMRKRVAFGGDGRE